MSGLPKAKAKAQKNIGQNMLVDLHQHLTNGKPLPPDTKEAAQLMLLRLVEANNKKEVSNAVVETLSLKFPRGAKKKKDHSEVVLYVELMLLSGMSKSEAYEALQEHTPGHIEPDSIRKRYEKFRNEDIAYWANSLHEKNGPFVVDGVPRFDNYEGLIYLDLFCALVTLNRPSSGMFG